MNNDAKLMVRLNDSLNSEASDVLASFGLDLSTAVRIFFIKIINCNAIPLNPDENDLINAILMGDYSIDEIEKMKEDARSDYKTVREKVPYLKKINSVSKKIK